MDRKVNEDGLTVSHNNPYQSTDYIHEEESLKAAVEHNKDSRLDEEVVRRKQSNKVYGKVLVAVESDAHLGGEGFDAEREEIARKSVLSCWNSIYGIGGDFVDNANKVSATNVFGNRVTPTQSLKIANLLFRDDAGKISFVIGGNHDAFWGNRNNATNLSPSEAMAMSLKVDYAPFALLLSIPVLTPDTLEVKNLTGLFLHSNLRGNKFTVTDSSIKYVVEKIAELGVSVDFINTEHLHTGSEGIYVTQLPNYDKNGKRLGDKLHYVWVFNGKSFQNDKTIYGGENMFVNKTNLKAILAGWDLNPYYTRNSSVTEPKYIPSVLPFNVLKKNENKPSMIMQTILKYYSLPEMNRYKEYWNKQSLAKVATEVQNAPKKLDKEMSDYIEAKKSKETLTELDEEVR